MNAAGIGVGISQAAQAATTGAQAEGEGLITIRVIDADVIQPIGQSSGNGTAGAWRAQGWGAIELGGRKAVAVIHQLRAAILQRQVDAGGASGAGSEGGIHQGGIDAAGAASELNAVAAVIGIREAADGAIYGR